MNAIKNAAHIAILAIWAVAGALFTFKVVMAGGPLAAMSVVMFWGWFAGFGALTTYAVSQLKGPLATIALHAAAVFVMQLLPRAIPFNFIRMGLDLLTGG